MKFRGFSLIEVVVSSAIMATTVGAVFALASMSIRLSLQAQDRLMAAEFAREGIETARQIRNANTMSADCAVSGNCPKWYTGLFPNGQLPPVAVAIDKVPSEVGFRFQPRTLSATNKCSEYIVRNLTSGDLTEYPNDPGAQPGSQTFCRRIFVERTHVPFNNEDELTTLEALRIRSQVAWLGYGKNQFRDPTANRPDSNENFCQPTSSEWCTEQIAIITDWRAP